MTNGQLKVLDIERISERLFEQAPIRERICRDYCIKDVGGPTDMAYQLVESIGQVRVPAEPKRLKIIGLCFGLPPWRSPATCVHGRGFWVAATSSNRS